jgi:hypothetical protein
MINSTNYIVNNFRLLSELLIVEVTVGILLNKVRLPDYIAYMYEGD